MPPLQAGERLPRDEFEQRYTAMPHLKKAELIEGVVVMPSPVYDTHARPHALLMAWLAAYWVPTPGIDLLDNVSVRLDMQNEPQPDAVLRIETRAGGQTRVSADHYIEGAPELAVEVASSSAAHDLREKLESYRRNGVSEYVVWEVEHNRLHWFVLEAGAYVPLAPGDDGVLRSRVFPGLHLAVSALLHYDRVGVVAAVQCGMATAEYAAFVERLQVPSDD
jgi:Uma2 family endonuclease